MEEEVVAHREQHVDVGLERQPSQKLGEALLHLGRVLREQLLELIDDQQSLVVLPAPAAEQRDGHLHLLEPHEIPHRLGVAGELRRPGPGRAPSSAGFPVP